MARAIKEAELAEKGLEGSTRKRSAKKEKPKAERMVEGKAAEMFLGETKSHMPEAGIENIEPRPELVSGYKDAIHTIDLPTVDNSEYGEYYSEQGLSEDELRETLGIVGFDRYSDEGIAFEQALEELYLSGEIIPNRTGGRGGGDRKYRRVEHPAPVSSERFEEVKRAVSAVLLERTDEFAFHGKGKRALTKDELKTYAGEEVTGLGDIEFSRVLHELVMDAKIERNEDKSKWSVRNPEWVRTSRRGLDKEVQRQRRVEGRVREIARNLGRAFVEEGWRVDEWVRYLDNLPESVVVNADFWVNLSEQTAQTIGDADDLSEDSGFATEHPLEAQQMLKSPELAEEIVRRLENVGRNAPDIESYKKVAQAYAVIVGAEIGHRFFEQGFPHDEKELRRMLDVPEDLEYSERKKMSEAKLGERMKGDLREVLSSIPEEDRSSPIFWANFNLPSALKGRFTGGRVSYSNVLKEVLTDVIVGKDELVPESLRSNVDFWRAMVGDRGYDTFMISHLDFEKRLATDPESVAIPENVLEDVSFWVALLRNSIRSVYVTRRGPSRTPTAKEVDKQLSAGYLKDFAEHEGYGAAVQEARQYWIERYS